MSDQIASIDTLSDFDMFFYYGQNDLALETKHDIFVDIMQPKRSLLGSRSVGAAGVQDYENTPVGLNLQINLPYDIVTSLSKRNQYVSNGENGTKDRRVAVSQSMIRVEPDRRNVNITVLYIPLANFRQTESLSIPLGIKQ